jgi:hypothetical protein
MIARSSTVSWAVAAKANGTPVQAPNHKGGKVEDTKEIALRENHQVHLPRAHAINKIWRLATHELEHDALKQDLTCRSGGSIGIYMARVSQLGPGVAECRYNPYLRSWCRRKE